MHLTNLISIEIIKMIIRLSEHDTRYKTCKLIQSHTNSGLCNLYEVFLWMLSKAFLLVLLIKIIKRVNPPLIRECTLKGFFWKEKNDWCRIHSLFVHKIIIFIKIAVVLKSKWKMIWRIYSQFWFYGNETVDVGLFVFIEVGNSLLRLYGGCPLQCNFSLKDVSLFLNVS